MVKVLLAYHRNSRSPIKMRWVLSIIIEELQILSFHFHFTIICKLDRIKDNLTGLFVPEEDYISIF